MWRDPVGRVRLAGMVEGVSYLLLLGVAMPLKHVAGKPEAVFVVGWAHGVLFVLYAVVATIAAATGRMTWGSWCWAAVASLLPFGPFVLDSRLRREEHAATKSSDPGPP